MRSRWFAVLAVLPALATPTVPGADGVVTARYTFNGRSGAVLDESGHGHTLSIVSGHGGAVRSVVHGPGTALAFPARCATADCPHVALQAPTSADLNPGTKD